MNAQFSGIFSPDMLAAIKDLSERATGFGSKEALFLPFLAGNIIGGTLVFNLLACAQVKDEVTSA